jgi:uncharacterized Zn-finger protein
MVPSNVIYVVKWPFSEYHYKTHMQSHSSKRQYECKCGKSFKTSHDFKRHEQRKSQTKEFKCDECGLAFSNNKDISDHKDKHKKRKRHECGMVGKAFGYKCNLYRHSMGKKHGKLNCTRK